MPSSAECGYTQSVCGHTGAGLRQAPRMRIAHVRMWAVAREYTIPQTIQMANRRVVGSRPHQISSPGSRDLRDLGQWDHDTSRCAYPSARVWALPPHTASPYPWYGHSYVATPTTAYRVLGLCAGVVIWTSAGSGLREDHPFWRSPGSRPRRCLIPSRIHGSRISSTPHLHELQSVWLYAMQALRRMHAYAMPRMCCCCVTAYQYLDA